MWYQSQTKTPQEKKTKNAVKMCTQKKFVDLNTFITKQERIKINELSIQLKNWEKEK